MRPLRVSALELLTAGEFVMTDTWGSRLCIRTADAAYGLDRVNECADDFHLPDPAKVCDTRHVDDTVNAVVGGT
jgi:hypothetical protein